MKKLALIFALFITGCSGEPEITLPDVKQVDMNDADAIIQSIGEKQIQVIDSTDSRDATKKIYKFDHAFSQLELSPNFALISWKQHDDISLNRAVKMGMNIS